MDQAAPKTFSSCDNVAVTAHGAADSAETSATAMAGEGFSETDCVALPSSLMLQPLTSSNIFSRIEPPSALLIALEPAQANQTNKMADSRVGSRKLPVLLFLGVFVSLVSLLLWISLVFGVFSAYFTGILRVRRVGKILDVFEVFLGFSKRPRKRRTGLGTFLTSGCFSWRGVVTKNSPLL